FPPQGPSPDWRYRVPPCQAQSPDGETPPRSCPTPPRAGACRYAGPQSTLPPRLRRTRRLQIWFAYHSLSKSYAMCAVMPVPRAYPEERWIRTRTRNGMPALFADRSAAGRQLARQLHYYARQPDAIVLALPRGGVPVGYEVARELQLPFDVFVVRKLG